ncbi:MAG: peptide chain release factor N(5)-glutamine methyltransferase, partial [Corynebacterium matruchotii]
MHEILRVAEATLAAAGVASPRHDAHTLAAHLIGTDPLTVRLMSPNNLPATFHHDYAELISRRAHREPLQHILGTAPFGPLTLTVGPGV